MARKCCYIGKGKVWGRKFSDPTHPPRFFGNVSQIDLEIDEETLEQDDYTTSGGGVFCSVPRIKAVNFNMTLNCMDTQNIALGLYSKVVDVTTGTPIANELHVAHKGSLVVLDNPIPGGTIVVEVAGGGTTYTVGTDYVVTGAGLFIPETSTIPAPTLTGTVYANNIQVDYTPQPSSAVELLAGAAQELYVVVDGENEAEGASKVVTKLYRMKFGPTSSFSIIGDKLGSIEISGKLLPNDAIVSAGLSRYGQFAVAI